MECSPGGSFLISRTIFTPLAAGESVAVPTAWPSAFLMMTTTGLLGACAGVCCACTAPGRENNAAATRTRDFTSVLLGAERKSFDGSEITLTQMLELVGE